MTQQAKYRFVNMDMCMSARACVHAGMCTHKVKLNNCTNTVFSLQ